MLAATLGVTAVGISGRGVGSRRSFAEQHRLNVPPLADPDLEVARAYGVLSIARITKRAVIVVDEAGRVAHRHDHTLGLDFQTVGGLRRTLDGLRRAA